MAATDSTGLCDCGADPGLCIASMIAPYIVLSQLSQRVKAASFCMTFTLLCTFQGLVVVFFGAAEDEMIKMWVARFNAISCVRKWSDVSALAGGLPEWMKNSNIDEVKDGEIFPCAQMFGDDAKKDGNITDWYDIESLLVMIFNIIGLVFEILVCIVFMSTLIKVRERMRSEGKAGGNCCTDWLKGLCCYPCFLSQTMRSAGVTGKSFSLFSVDAELGLPGAASSTKDVPVAVATAQ